MQNEVHKSEFVLSSYMRSDDIRAICQILNTVIPYMLLWWLAIQAALYSIWLLLPILVLMTLFSVRCFSLMHDCGHYSLFRSKRINRLVGFILGVINAIPQYAWSRDHAYHHKTNGDWERYRGVADFLSTQEFSQLSPYDQRVYQILRHPIMTIPGGFFYLAIKPRLGFMAGIYDFAFHVITCWRTHPGMTLSEIITSHQSKHWPSQAEFWDSLLNNVCVVAGWVILSSLLGPGLFLSLYSIVLTFSAVIFISVFFVQHIYEGSYAHQTAGWNYLLGAIEGSSYLELPGVLKWFTASIGFHNIHHLSERIPNYHLEACHQKNLYLLASVRTLHLSDILGCSKFILWDTAANTLISVQAFHQKAALNVVPYSSSGL